MRNIEGIKIVDATIRDGGLVNDFFFTDEFVKKVYETNVAAGVDYMEFGYRADKKMFDPSKFGKWKFASDEDIFSIVGDNPTGLKLCVMADVGRCDFKNDIHKKSDSPLSLIRVATYIETFPEAIEMIEFAAKQGYEVTCNLMAISKCTMMQLSKALDALAQTPVMGVYIVDSYGALYPKEVRKLTWHFQDHLLPYGKLTGIHAHNNQQCAFANTIEAHELNANAGCHLLWHGTRCWQLSPGGIAWLFQRQEVSCGARVGLGGKRYAGHERPGAHLGLQYIVSDCRTGQCPSEGCYCRHKEKRY